MTTTLISGVDGFTGRYLAPLLSARGHIVHGLVRSAATQPVPGVTALHAADLVDEASVRAVVEAVRPDHVVHLAAIAFVAHADLFDMYRTNIIGTRNLLSSCTAADLSLSSIIVASSANVYGNGHEGMLDERTHVAPANDYGITKSAVEQLVQIHAHALPIITVRPFNYTGVGQSDAFLIPKIVRHVRDRAPVIELGNLDVARDFSDVRTVVEAYCRLLHCPEAIGETFNVCSGQAVTLREVVRTALDIAGHDMDILVNPAFVRANEVKLLCGDPAKIEGRVGPLHRPPLRETLAWMLAG